MYIRLFAYDIHHNNNKLFIVDTIFCSQSTTIIQRWEARSKSSCTDKRHKAPVLKALLRECGLSTNLSVKRLRAVLASLKRIPVPTCPKQVDSMLISRGEKVSGPGRASQQQRRMILLELMDPNLKKQLGKSTIETGDYNWGEHLSEDLYESVIKYLNKCVPLTHELPFGYDTTTTHLWGRRRQAGLTWAQSTQGRSFAQEVYKTYVTVFASVTKDCAESAFTQALEQFCVKKRLKEEGDLRQRFSTLLQPLYSSCICTAENVFDKFSFISRNLYHAVFDFFTIKVRNVPEVKIVKRIKDREDDAKTYYICGCVLRSLRTQVKRKTKKQELLASLDALTVDSKVAAKLGLPTRHVAIRNRGGLQFASKEYYNLMCKIEMRFYSTLFMR